MRVRTERPRPKSYNLADANRVFLLVTPSGGKLWRWNYNYDCKNQTLALGAYPFLTLADARAKRDEAFTILSEGRDPFVARKLKIEAPGKLFLLPPGETLQVRKGVGCQSAILCFLGADRVEDGWKPILNGLTAGSKRSRQHQFADRRSLLQLCEDAR